MRTVILAEICKLFLKFVTLLRFRLKNNDIGEKAFDNHLI